MIEFLPISKIADVNPSLNGSCPSDDDNVSFLPMASVLENGTLENIEERTYNSARKGYTAFNRGDVLLAKITPCMENGKAAITESLPHDVGFGSTEFHVLRPAKEIDGKYLFYMVWNPFFRFFAEKAMTGSAGQKRVPTGYFNRHDVPVPMKNGKPDLAEQKRIAAILDKADAIRRKRQQALALTDDLLRSTFLDMFGDPVTNPKGWDNCPVGDVTDCIVPGRDKPKSFTGNIPWVTTEDLIHLGKTDGSSKEIGLSREEIKEVRARIIPQGSVLISCVGDLGISSMAMRAMVVNQQLHSFQCGSHILPEFLSFYLSFKKDWMIRRATQTTLPYLNKTNCNSIPIFVPEINIQRNFAIVFNFVQSKKEQYQPLQDAADLLFKSCLQRAFRGEL